MNDKRYALGAAGEVFVADDLTELVAILIDGYGPVIDSGDVGQALFLRYDYAVAAASTAQAVICDRVATQDPEFFASLTEAELTALLSNKENPLHLPFLDLDNEWTNPIPLVLVRTDYQPFTALRQPSGNVIVVDPYTERSLLASLTSINEIDVSLFINEDVD